MNLEQANQNIQTQVDTVQNSVVSIGSRTTATDTSVANLLGVFRKLESSATQNRNSLDALHKNEAERNTQTSRIDDIWSELQELKRKVNQKSSILMQGNKLLSR